MQHLYALGLISDPESAGTGVKDHHQEIPVHLSRDDIKRYQDWCTSNGFTKSIHKSNLQRREEELDSMQ